METMEMLESKADFSEELKDLKSEIVDAKPETTHENSINVQPETYKWVKLDPHKEYNVCDNPLTKGMGTKMFNWNKETYYTSNPKARPHFNIHRTAHPVPGVHIAKWDGTVRDKEGYIVLACNGLKFGSTVMTSLWPWKVYDRWWMKRKNHIDIFTNR